MELKETTKYNLLDSSVEASFKLTICKKELSMMFMIELTKIIVSREHQFKVIENDNEFIFIITNGSCSGDFYKHVKSFKEKTIKTISMIMAELDSEKIDIELKKTLKKEDVAQKRLEVTLLSIQNETLLPKDFTIKGNPDYFLTKNNDFRSLHFRIGKLHFTNNDFEDGYLGSMLKKFCEEFNINTYQDTIINIDINSIPKDRILELIQLFESEKNN